MTDSGQQRIVLSTRSPAPGDEELALAHNVTLVSCPSFYYQLIAPPRDILEDVLSKAHEAWVFTSRRGVDGWWNVWKRHQASERFELVPIIYAVGESTRQRAVDIFGEPNVRMPDEQHGIALAKRLLEDGIRSAVHFCGVDRRTELYDTFMINQVKLTELEVYSRTDIRKPDPEIVEICSAGKINAIFFFSPDGVTGFYRLYGLPGGNWMPVAIGPTTASEVKKITGREPYIASSPTLPDMILHL